LNEILPNHGGASACVLADPLAEPQIVSSSLESRRLIVFIASDTQAVEVSPMFPQKRLQFLPIQFSRYEEEVHQAETASRQKTTLAQDLDASVHIVGLIPACPVRDHENLLLSLPGPKSIFQLCDPTVNCPHCVCPL
jgi:hypothetical protein